MLLGYARVSKADDQDTAAQVSALKAAGCTRVYERQPPADGGIGPSYTASSTICAMAMLSSSGNSTACHARSRICCAILEKIDAAGATFRP